MEECSRNLSAEEQQNQDRYAYAYFIACGIAAIFINTIVFYIALKYVDLRAKANQIFVLNMTGADLFYGMIYMVSRPFSRYFPRWYCHLYYVITYCCQMGSALFLLLLNVDKFISIRYPLHYHRFVTERVVLVQTFFVWLGTCAIASFNVYGPFMFPDPAGFNCDTVRYRPSLYYIIYAFVCYVTPIIISFAISVYIFIIAQGASRSQQTEGGPKTSSRVLMKRILFVFSSTMWTSVTSLPYRIGYGAYSICAETLNKTTEHNVSTAAYGTRLDPCMPYCFLKELIFSLFCIMFLGALGNPIVTIVTQRTYRNAVQNMCRRVLGRRVVRRQDTMDFDTSTQGESARLKAGRDRASCSSARMFELM